MTLRGVRKTETKAPESLKVNRSARKGPELPCPTEEQESLALAKWARWMVENNQEPRLKLLRCGFEGLRLPMGLRMKVKRQSVTTGWPDWWLGVPQYKNLEFGEFKKDLMFMGLYVELKRERGGTVSDEQKEMHALLRDQGYRVDVCKGATAAIRAIKNYLGMPDRP